MKKVGYFFMGNGRILEIAAIEKGRESSLRDYRRVKVNYNLLVTTCPIVHFAIAVHSAAQ